MSARPPPFRDAALARPRTATVLHAAAEASTLAALRADFEQRSRRAMSMPLAGAAVWLAVALAGALLPPPGALLAMVMATGAIFPLALAIARWRGEALVSNPNPLAKLLGSCIFMVNLLWAVHIPLLVQQPAYVPLSLGIALGLHWVVYSWIVQHPLGVVHAVLRTGLVLAAWLAFPERGVSAVALAVAAAYAVSLLQMGMRQVTALGTR